MTNEGSEAGMRWAGRKIKHCRFNGIYSAKGRERKRTVREHRSHTLGPRLSRTLSSPSRSSSHQYLSPFAISMATDTMTRRCGHRHFCFAALVNFGTVEAEPTIPQPVLAAIRPQKRPTEWSVAVRATWKDASATASQCWMETLEVELV